jgi:hypothetical protein
MSVVRRADGGGLAPRPRIGIVQARDRAEKRPTARPRKKRSREVKLSIAIVVCGSIL